MDAALSSPKPKPWWWRWMVQPVVQQVTQGVSPVAISRAISWGMVIGVFPIIGSTTLLTLMVGVPLKLNQPILQVFKSVATPIQWATVLLFYRAGEWLFGAEHVSIHIPTLIERFFAEPGPFFRDYGMTALYGIVVWVLVAPILFFAVFGVVRPLVVGLAESVKKRKLRDD